MTLSVAHLFRKSVYSAWRMRPVRIMIVWKHCRSMAQSLQSFTAVIVAVRWQLYRMANSPSTFAPDNVERYLPSRDTSTRPSGRRGRRNEVQLVIRIKVLWICRRMQNWYKGTEVKE